MESDGVIERKIDHLQNTVDRLSTQIDNIKTKDGNQVVVGDGDDDDDDDGDENKERGNWSNHIEFVLACLGYAVGLGNVWRFPYLCYKNGGAVFFIPYCVMLLFVGVPIFFMELSIGQFTSEGPLTCWGMVPFFKGIGVGMCVVSSLVAIYYNMIIAWAIYYFFASFTSELPWEKCDRSWASVVCEDFLNDTVSEHCENLDMDPRDNGLCYDTTWDNATVLGIWNKTLAKENGFEKHLASRDYLNREVLHVHTSDGIGDMGPILWKLLLCYLAAWVIVFLSLVNGIKSSGKVVYFTALFPYVVLVILLIRGLTLEGHSEGIDFYIKNIDWGKLSDAQVWKDAAVQIFFSLSASWGGLIALSSYNKFHNDCLRDALFVSISNCLTSFFAGFVIFSFIGFLAHELGENVEDVADAGVTLAFVVYPAAVVEMPVSTLWALLFFLMLVTLGLDSEFALVETVTTSIMDTWPSLRKKKALVVLGVCVVLGICGLPLTTEGGSYLLELMDAYAGGWNVLLIALFECTCVAYVYGFFRFKEDLRTMFGDTPLRCVPWDMIYWWWALCWYFFTPIGVLFILIFSWVDYEPLTAGDYEYPTWADAIGWILTMAVVISMIGTSIVLLIVHVVRGGNAMDMFRPNKYWGPSLPKHRKLMGRYLDETQFEVNPRGEDRGLGFEMNQNGIKLLHDDITVSPIRRPTRAKLIRDMLPTTEKLPL